MLIYHAEVRQLPGGFVGIHFFFVISGFLTTALIIRQMEAPGRLTLRCFYARRSIASSPPPGDSHTFTRQWDEDLGHRYDRAEPRLQLDLAAGRPFAVLRGDHDPTVTTAMPPTTDAPVRPTWAAHVD